MIPSALSRISRSATATGPFGSKMPSVQPPSNATTVRTTASKPYRMLDLAKVEGEADAGKGICRELGTHRSDDPAIVRRARGQRCVAPVVEQERCKQREQV